MPSYGKSSHCLWQGELKITCIPTVRGESQIGSSSLNGRYYNLFINYQNRLHN